MTEIKKLSDYAHSRLRTEMYLGSRNPHTQTILQIEDGKTFPVEVTWTPALYTAFREILDNSLDEVIGHGYGNTIKIEYDPTNIIFSVEDNGRGIPIEFDRNHNCHLATLVMTEARAGRNFGERETVVGTNGIGASIVNFCSEFFELEIHRDNKKFIQRFTEGNVLNDDLVIGDPKITKSTGKSGTKVTFKPSREVFKDMILPEEFLLSRVTEIAISNPEIKFYYNNKPIKIKPKIEQNLFGNTKPIVIDIKEDKFESCFYIIPDWITNGDHYHTLVNNIPAFNGGVHVESFKKLFVLNLISGLEKESRKRKLSPNRSDVSEGILVYNITKMNAPNFDSQSKTRLINEEVGNIIKKYLENPDIYKEIIKKNKEWIDAIYQRCAERTHKKDALEIAKLSKKIVKSKVAKLIDATGTDRSKCSLFITEGLSAVSGICSSRDPELHGAIDLTGKVINVNGENPKKILDNRSLSDIMNSVGLIIGKPANRKDLRYGKILLAADQDPDGNNITALLINFFYTFWPELFDKDLDPIINVFMTPFIIAEKNNKRKYWYSDDYHTFDSKEYSGWRITRAKGLATLEEVDWKYSLAKPKVYPIIEDGNMKESLDLIFNTSRADDRKKWIGL